MKIDRVLVATDFSPACEEALRYASSLASQFNACLYLLHVLPEERQAPDAVADVAPGQWSESTAADQMRRLRAQLLRQHENCVTAVVSGEPATRIVQKARDVQADLIVMGVHVGDRPGRASVAGRVMPNAPCPVLTVSGTARPAYTESVY